MPNPFFARITPAGYAQYPDLVVVTPLPGFSPGSSPPRPTPGPPLYPSQGPGFPTHPIVLPPVVPGGPPLVIWGGPWEPPYPSQGPGFPTHPIAPGGPRPPLGFWGPNDPRPTHPIVLPPNTEIPPDLLPGLPDHGEPGSPSNPYPPGEVPEHPSTGLNTFYMVIPYVGVVGPFTVPPGVGMTPDVPPAVPDPVPPQAP